MTNLHTLASVIGATLALVGACPASAQQTIIDNWRDYDRRGVNVFEDPQTDNSEFNGPRVRIGGAFTQQFQALDHSNSLADLDGDGKLDNELYALKPGFNLATANLNLDVQLAPGVRLNLITYLSSRHHAEAWVKGGFIQFDELPFLKSQWVNGVMEKVRIRVGHMEVNYGDTHFRRTDNGNSLYNPFVGNYIVDAFNTEIGGEVYYFDRGLIAMASVTGGEINGNVNTVKPGVDGEDGRRAPSFIGKLGYDTQVNPDLRLRVTGSVYHTASSAANHLYDGDRSGSRYYSVMSPPDAAAGGGAVFRNGRYSPGFGDALTAGTVNALVEFGGFETFLTYELAQGRGAQESAERNMRQYAGELVYRFGESRDVFVGARYNNVKADDPSGREVTIDRYQIGGGWFLTDNIVLKGEYVNQDYSGFAAGSLLSDGSFKGIMLEAAVGF